MNNYKKWKSAVDQWGTPLLAFSAEAALTQYSNLTIALPNVKLYYAIKAFPSPLIINTLHKKTDCHFDLSSIGEIDLLKNCDVPAKKTIYTHPIKSSKDIQLAIQYGCQTFVVENEEELKKFIPYKNCINLLIRITAHNPESMCNLSIKFGCDIKEAKQLIHKATEINIPIKGFSFHAGSQAPKANVHKKAIEECGKLIEEHQTSKLHPLDTIDIGGGFPTFQENTLAQIKSYCDPIRKAITTLPANIQYIAEPGRYLASSSTTALFRIIGKSQKKEKIWYYIDDGVYGSFSGQIYEKADYTITPFPKQNEKPNDTKKNSVIAGPTCDSIDIIKNNILLPELEIGDILYAGNMGAYTWCSANTFNSLPIPKIISIDDYH